jgi:hypothetical protein
MGICYILFADHLPWRVILLNLKSIMHSMAETTVASLFGIKAGIVWKALNQNGASNIFNLVKATSLSREEVYGALGWLGRENKLVMERKGRAMVFSLQEEETRLSVPEETTEPAPKAKSKSRKTKQPKKTKKARSVKSSIKQTKSQANQSERVEEFLLH